MNDLEKSLIPEIDPQLYRQLCTGKYLLNLRKSLGFTLTYVSKQLEITHPYLLDIEKGLKTPSDALISRISKFFNVDEDDLFQRYGKVPILAQKEVFENKGLQDTLAEVGRNKRLTDVQKERLYNNIYKTYKKFLKELDEEEARRKEGGDFE